MLRTAAFCKLIQLSIYIAMPSFGGIATLPTIASWICNLQVGFVPRQKTACRHVITRSHEHGLFNYASAAQIHQIKF
jgi:hypothetical protein